MITYAELVEVVDARIDDEGSQRYLDVQDKIPAANSAIRRGIAACNWALANRKGSEEQLIELKEDRIFQSNSFSGISLNATTPPLDHTVWSVMGVYAEPETSPVWTAPSGLPDQTVALDLVPVGSKYPVRRHTAEELAVAQDNRSMPGNEKLAATPLRSYAYILVNRPTIAGLHRGDWEILIRPGSISARKPFWVTYLRTPVLITTVNDTIDFPQSFKEILAEWACEYLSFKQGDQTNLNTLASKDAATLFQFST